MTVTSYSLPAVVDLKSATGVAKDLLAHINASAMPGVNAFGLQQAGVVLLQMLVAARRLATAQGKPFTVEAAPDGVLCALLSTCGLDPVLCGITASAPTIPAPMGADLMQRC